MKILIVGGGIAGLSLAALLKKNEWTEVVLVERAPKFSNIGFMLGLWGNGRRILNKLGIEKVVAEENGYELPWAIYKSPREKTLMNVSFEQFRQFGGPNVVIKRSDLHNGVAYAATGTDIRFNTFVKKIEQLSNDKVNVEFNDNTKDEFDLVIGADGVKSSVRELIFGRNFLKHYGWGVWVYWLPKEFKEMPLGTISIGGSGKMSAIFPWYEGGTAWFITTNPLGLGKAAETRREILLRSFQNWHPLTDELLKFIPDNGEEIFYDDLAHIDMKHWYKGRVVLLGDARHATSPISGMGASMAMEDAYVLYDELQKFNSGSTNTIEAALEKFERRRNPRIKKYRKAAGRIDYFTMVGGLQGKIRDLIMPYIPSSFFTNPAKRVLEDEI